LLEKEMRRRLKLKVLSEKLNIVFQPIESARTGLGIPDIFFKTINDQGWIELKEIEVTSYGAVVVSFRPGQLPWARRYMRLYGKVILLATFKKSIYTLGWEDVLIAIEDNNIMARYESIAELKFASRFIKHFKDFSLRALFNFPDSK